MKFPSNFLSLLVVAGIARSHRLGLESKSRQLANDKKPQLNWGDDFDNIGDNIGDFLDDIGDKWGDWIDGNGVIDWDAFDFGDFDFNNFTWGDIDWGNNDWSQFLGDMDFGNSDIDFCGILEAAVGMGKEFGIEGDCQCSGAIDTDLKIGCTFEHQCVNPLSPVCTKINLDYTMGNVISVGACMDFAGDTFPEVCFTYEFDMAGQIPQTCGASYDGNPCECEIEDFCIRLDCSMYLPGAAMDTCQLLETITGDDASNFLPEFPAFEENYTPTFESINWDSMDWKKLDWDNFDLDKIEWGSDSLTSKFEDILNMDPEDGYFCTLLQTFIGMSDEFSSKGGCDCSELDQEGFFMDCSFENACVSDDMCASLDLEFGFNDLGAVNTEVCVDFADDGHAMTCMGFDIPIAGTNSAPTCTTTYGGQACQCTIDENFCISVDCSAYDENAVVDTCEIMNWKDGDAASFIPRFELPGTDKDTVVSDGDADVDSNNEASGGPDSDDEDSNNDVTGGNGPKGSISKEASINSGDNSGAVATSIILESALLLLLPLSFFL